MTDKGWQDLQPWNNTEIKDDDGSTPIRFGLAATLYFQNGHSRACRQAALDCFNEYQALCGQHLRWHCVTANSNRKSPVSSLQSRDMSPYLLSPNWETPQAHDEAWAYLWHGGHHKNDASPFKIEAFGCPASEAQSENALSYIQVSFPVLWFQEQGGAFPELIKRWCDRLHPFHGYGGITLIESPDRGLAQHHAFRIPGIAAKHPGIEIDSPMSHSLATEDAIKGGNWLTVLSDFFVATLGGADTLALQLGPPFAIVHYQGGILIVAGSVPEAGDVNRQIDTPLYRKLAAVLQPVRVQTHPAPYATGRFADDAAFEQWLARFDK